jgi:F-type H+-transporting ATPase subunit epsilon
MRNDLNLQILSPANIAFSGIIRSVHVSAALGELEIFLNHISLVSSLLPGYITVHHVSGSDEKYFTNGGYIEVNNNEVSLIVDDIIDIKTLDKSYFKKQVEILSVKLQDKTLNDDDYQKLTESVALYNQYAA